jgi:hypothetical protein
MQTNCFVLLQFLRWKYGYFWGFSARRRTSPRARAATTWHASTSIGGREIAGGTPRESQQRKRSAAQLAVLSTATMPRGAGTGWPPSGINGNVADRGRVGGMRVGICTFSHRLIPRFEQKAVRIGGNAAPAPSSNGQKERVRPPGEPLIRRKPTSGRKRKRPRRAAFFFLFLL